MCQFSFIRGKKPFSSVLLLCLKICSIPSRALQMATKVDRNASYQILCSWSKKNEDSVSKPRNIDQYNILITAQTSPTCGMFAPHFPFRNASSLQNSCKSEIIPATVFPIKGTTVLLLLSPSMFLQVVISTIKEVQGFKQISTVTAQKFEVFSRKSPLPSNYA